MNFSRALKAVTTGIGLASLAICLSFPSVAAEEKKEKRKTQVMSQSVGKKVQAAFDAYAEERINDAITMLEEIEAKKEFDQAFVKRLLGNMYAGQKGGADKAIKLLKEAVDLDVLNPNEHEAAIKLLADLNLQEGNHKEALSGYKHWMEFSGKEDPEIYVRMSQAYYQLKQLDKIIDPADRAIALYKKQKPAPYMMKVSSYYERKMYKEAAEVVSEAISHFPEEGRYWIQLGQFYLLHEDYEKALSSFDLAHKQGHLKKPNHFVALAQLYAAYAIPYQAALIQERYMNEGIIAKDEKNLVSLANYLHQSQEFKKSAKYYQLAAEKTQDPGYYKRIGDLLLMDEDYKKAIVAYNKAVELGSDKSDKIRLSLIEAHFYSGDYKNAYKIALAAKKEKSTRRSASGWLGYIKDTAERKNVKI
ncbi:tetratricopeptide repeat protein [Algibacillus agarilyticus]|uniref:tetratricopeptide repeat protein n=1 Tax=Algibacillus agarilyticus TaxID=2234133 RepID=UPI000DCFC4D7|nr:tetratricopeptide repeat protein [Algibacillus agarilyticus]